MRRIVPEPKTEDWNARTSLASCLADLCISNMYVYVYVYLCIYIYIYIYQYLSDAYRMA